MSVSISWFDLFDCNKNSGSKQIRLFFFSINFFSSFRYSMFPENCLYGSVTRYNLSHNILLGSLSDRDQRKYHIYYEWEKTKLAFP